MALTTTPHEQGIRIPDDAWTAGGSEKRAFASPWYVATIKHRTFDRHQGTLAPSFVDRVASALREYVPEQP